MNAGELGLEREWTLAPFGGRGGGDQDRAIFLAHTNHFENALLLTHPFTNFKSPPPPSTIFITLSKIFLFLAKKRCRGYNIHLNKIMKIGMNCALR